MAIVGGFALFHGLAHTGKAPAEISGLEYMAGFVATTAVLLGSGLVLGTAGQRWMQPSWVRSAGGTIAITGALLAVG